MIMLMTHVQMIKLAVLPFVNKGNILLLIMRKLDLHVDIARMCHWRSSIVTLHL